MVHKVNSILPDGEYELDLSSLFCTKAQSEIFGVRCGFKPETIDDSFSSLLVKDDPNNLYILRSEMKDTSAKDDYIFFEGRMPHSSNAGSRSQSRTPSPELSLSPSSSLSSSPVADFTDMVLLYDSIARKFKVNRFNGVIKFTKSRSPSTMRNIIETLSKKIKVTKPGKSMADMLILAMKRVERRSVEKDRKIYPPPLPTISPKRSLNSKANKRHIISKKVTRKASPIRKRKMKRNSGSSERKEQPKRKKSKLLRAAERAVHKENIKKQKQQVPATVAHKVNASKEKPPKDDDLTLSDKDLADFADELEEELDVTNTSVNKPSLDSKHFEDGDSPDYSEMENAIDDNDTESVKDDSTQFHVFVEDNPKLKSSKRRISETEGDPVHRKSFNMQSSSKPTDRKPISMRELAAGVNMPRLSPTSNNTEGQEDPNEEALEIDEQELDNALDDLDEEISEEE